jgi:transposase
MLSPPLLLQLPGTQPPLLSPLCVLSLALFHSYILPRSADWAPDGMTLRLLMPKKNARVTVALAVPFKTEPRGSFVDHDVSSLMTQALVSDALWEVIAPLLPAEPPKPKGGRPRLSDRAALTGILFVLKTGLPWEYLPQELGYGSGVTCWRRLRDWERAGVWHRSHRVLLDQLGDADQSDWSRASLAARSSCHLAAWHVEAHGLATQDFCPFCLWPPAKPRFAQAPTAKANSTRDWLSVSDRVALSRRAKAKSCDSGVLAQCKQAHWMCVRLRVSTWAPARPGPGRVVATVRLRSSPHGSEPCPRFFTGPQDVQTSRLRADPCHAPSPAWRSWPQPLSPGRAARDGHKETSPLTRFGEGARSLFG